MEKKSSYFTIFFEYINVIFVHFKVKIYDSHKEFELVHFFSFLSHVKLGLLRTGTKKKQWSHVCDGPSAVHKKSKNRVLNPNFNLFHYFSDSSHFKQRFGTDKIKKTNAFYIFHFWDLKYDFQVWIINKVGLNSKQPVVRH